MSYKKLSGSMRVSPPGVEVGGSKDCLDLNIIIYYASI